MMAAMKKVADTISPTIAPVAKEDDAPIDKSVLIRTTEAERERWKQASSETKHGQAISVVRNLHKMQHKTSVKS